MHLNSPQCEIELLYKTDFSKTAIIIQILQSLQQVSVCSSKAVGRVKKRRKERQQAGHGGRGRCVSEIYEEVVRVGQTAH